MKVLDLFAGLRGWSEPFEQRGHDVRTLELDPKFPGITYRMNIIHFAENPYAYLGKWSPDIILASPPCTTFSMMTVGRNWTHDNQPKTQKAVDALKMVESTISIISWLMPRWFIIENPRAKLRKMPQMQGFERKTVTYCQYGDTRMKPTDLWGGFPPCFDVKPMCKNGDPCHVAAPRGSYTGTQGMDSAVSAKIPYALAMSVCLAAENTWRQYAE